MTAGDLNSISSQCVCCKSSIARKPEDHPKNLLKNVTLHFLKFYLSKLTDKIFPIWCNIRFSLLFVLYNAAKTDTLILHHMGKIVIICQNKI